MSLKRMDTLKVWSLTSQPPFNYLSSTSGMQIPHVGHFFVTTYVAATPALPAKHVTSSLVNIAVNLVVRLATNIAASHAASPAVIFATKTMEYEYY